MDFILHNPKYPPILFPADIQEKISACRAFGVKALPSLEPAATGLDYIQALEREAVGACRHRAAVFKYWMMQHHPEIPVRIVMNISHAFIEIRYNDQWINLDLGGYPATTHIAEPFRPKPVSELQDLSFSAETTKVPSKSSLEKPRIVHQFLTQQAPQVLNSNQRLQHFLRGGDKKVLINSSEVSAISKMIQIYCKHTSRPIFVIHHPDDLVTSAPRIQQEKQADGSIYGRLQPGPGGPLHEFLIAHQDTDLAPVLLVDYTSFSSSDMVRFNALLDDERRADATVVPEQAVIIGLLNPTLPNTYQGADFLSRFDSHHTWNPMPLPALTVPQRDASVKQVPWVIDFMGRPQWEDQLLGRWELSGTQLHFMEGELIKALRAHSDSLSLDLRNAPWQSKSFIHFWEGVFLKREVTLSGEVTPLPHIFNLTQSQGYDWRRLALVVREIPAESTSPQTGFVLNTTTLSDFLGQYVCDNETKTVSKGQGLISQHAKQLLKVFVSAPLSKASWAQLLQSCLKHEVSLQLSSGFAAYIPKELGVAVELLPEVKSVAWSQGALFQDCLIYSSDREITCRQISDAFILDVTEVDCGNLFTKIDAFFDKETLCFKFFESTGILINALREGKTVVLTGSLSTEIEDRLNALFLQRQQQEENLGRLIVVSLSKETSIFSSKYFHHEVTVAEKKEFLGSSHLALLTEQEYEQYSCATLRAMQIFRQRHPEKEGHQAWEGLRDLPLTAISTVPTDLSQALESSRLFEQERLSAVEAALIHAPFIFLAGKTGVGKTTFMTQCWQKKYSATYFGEEHLKEWALSDKQGLKTLFIDEANISSRQWSEFEGLFNRPPGILIGNEFFELTAEHKVIFAGNPLSYGGERRLPSLFERHGNSVIFEPMPSAYLYQELLAPIFNGISTRQAMLLAEPILKAAEFFSRCSPDKVLVSPRELTMMALLAVNYCNQHPEADALEVVHYYVQTIGESLVPKESLQIFIREHTRPVSLPAIEDYIPEKFCITPTNQKVLDAIKETLALRRFKQENTANPAIAHGGLGGLVLEGIPGIGKSALVAKTLVAHGLTQGSLSQEYTDREVFYVMPASMPYSEKTKLLLKAFHEGAVVVIDEINSSAMMERLLNALLMGRTPDGLLAKNPGFTIIGTQNPPTMAGRVRATSALQRRLRSVVIPEYTKEDMIAIVAHEGLSLEESRNLVGDYLAAQRQQPDLCFRQLIKRARHCVRAHQKEPLDVQVEAEVSTSLEPALLDNLDTANLQYFLIDTPSYLLSINQQLVAIEDEIKILASKGHEDAVGSAQQLRDKIYAQLNQDISLSQFKTNCLGIIKSERPKLEKYAGWKQLLGNLVLAILGVGIIYGLSTVVNKKMTGHYLFFRPKIAKNLDCLEELVALQQHRPKNNHGITLFHEKKTNRVPQPSHLSPLNGTIYGVTGRVREQIKDNEKPNTEEIGTALASTSSAEPFQAAQISNEADKSSLIAAQKALDESKETLYRTRLDVRRINEAMAQLPEYKVEFDSVSKELASIAAKIGVQRNKLGERERVLEELDKELQDAEAMLANKKRDKVKLGPKYETTLRLNKAAVEEKKVKVESARQLVGEAKRKLASLDARKIDLEGRITSISIKIASAENRLANGDEVRANHNRALEGHQNAQRQRLFQARQFSSSVVSGSLRC